MTTLQEQFEKAFPDKSVGVIDVEEEYKDSNFTNWDLDLRGYKNLTKFDCHSNELTSLNVDGCVNLCEITCSSNNLTSIDFLNQLPNPEKLKELSIYNNNIQPTNISIFSKFINLKYLKIGTTENGLKEGKHNKFYGSLKSYQNLTKLTSICIEATDVNEGLEYLPESLAKRTKKATENKEYRGGYASIECSPHNTNAKCKTIQDQLRPFNYDIEAWQLVNKQYPNLTKQIQELNKKITQTQQELTHTKTQEADKTKKIERLETKLKLLEETHAKLKTELTQEQQQHNQTKTNFQSQLRDLATILFPSNSPIDNINFANLKIQAEKIKDKNQELKPALSEEQKVNLKLQTELERERRKIQKLELTKSTIHQQTQTDFPSQKKKPKMKQKKLLIFVKIILHL